MSSTIKSLVSGRIMDIASSSADPNRTYLSIEGDVSVGITIKRADLIAALRIEGILPAEPEPLAEWQVNVRGMQVVPADAVVILRETLPPVHEDAYRLVISDGDMEKPINSNLTATQHRRLALEHHSAAEYLDANPPIPVAVEEFAAAIFAARHPMERWDNTVDVVQDDYRTQALALIDAGWSK